MGDFDHLYQQGGLYLSPGQHDLLLAALSSNTPAQKQLNRTPQLKPDHSPDGTSSNDISAPPSGSFDDSINAFGFGEDESPFLDFNPEVDFDFPGSESLIGDLPSSTSGQDYELGEKRKSIDGLADEENEDTGKKRRESEAKKPGRKPLTSEPTTKRKAQNRAAQRAFRERKEKHLKDLETKVEELQSASDSASQENGMLRAQVERLQVELREYRKRLSWMSNGNGLSAVSAIPASQSRGSYGLQNNEFMFDFPKFGDLPGSILFPSQTGKNDQFKLNGDTHRAPGVLARVGSQAGSIKSNASTPTGIETTRSANTLNGTPSGNSGSVKTPNNHKQSESSHETSTSESPSSSSDSHQSQMLSSNGTSPEPSLNSSPSTKLNESACSIHGGTNGEESFCAKLGMACGSINNPIPAAKPGSNFKDQSGPSDNAIGFDWLAQQNGGQFDPVLFGEWREPQEAVLSQDFGSFFNDAFPLPDLGSPSHNLSEATQQPKKDLISLIDSKLEEEVVPGEDQSQMLSCTKIWDRLQSMEKFRNGEIDVDSLCSELRTKARCSEGGVVVNQQDVEEIVGRAK
ncbi:AP-1-like transcription factor napA [Penicillium taxi]|uniref:AP-1-like transcription factor napA n=1 Tax=Penicillium taxi TaxID=168475 RepID=UPI002545A512|nr:AP-1-like transcription factor napA [Penicillium taxi]KAJ5907362.1 AP-1-like transcription factor napA [Penicillium taxi]